MGKGSVTESIEELVTPITEENRLELVDVEYKKEGKNWFLRIFIDKEGGVTVDDCTRVSREIEDLIDVEEVVPTSYVLEVSSPGLDRPLKKEKDFLRFKGKRAQVTTYTPIHEQKNFKERSAISRRTSCFWISTVNPWKFPETRSLKPNWK